MNKSQRVLQNNPSSNDHLTSDQDLYITCHQCHVVNNYSQTKPVFLANGEESGERICDDCRIQNVKKTTRCTLRACSTPPYRASNFRTLPSKFFDLPDGHFKRDIVQQYGIDKSTKACCNLCYIRLTKAALLAKNQIDTEDSTEDDDNNNYNIEDDNILVNSNQTSNLQPKKGSLKGKVTSNDVTSWVDKIKKKREQSAKITDDINTDSLQSKNSLSHNNTHVINDEHSTSHNTKSNVKLTTNEKVSVQNQSTAFAAKLHQSSNFIKPTTSDKSAEIIQLSACFDNSSNNTISTCAVDENAKLSIKQKKEKIKVRFPFTKKHEKISEKSLDTRDKDKEVIPIDIGSDSDDGSIIVIDEPSVDGDISISTCETNEESTDEISSSGKAFFIVFVEFFLEEINLIFFFVVKQ